MRIDRLTNKLKNYKMIVNEMKTENERLMLMYQREK